MWMELASFGLRRGTIGFVWLEMMEGESIQKRSYERLTGGLMVSL
jgi:hypothetical protein